MGNSLQDYRCKIGQFQAINLEKLKKSMKMKIPEETLNV
jgi:hypothetical protein